MIDFADIQEFATQLTGTVDDQSGFELLERASEKFFDHILFTTLRFDYQDGVMTRLYSNREDVSPVGGTKPMPSGPWADCIISDKRCYIGYTKQDLKDVFFDHQALWAIGCESVMNVPIIWQNQVVGSCNILGRSAQYDESDAAAMSVFAQLAATLFVCPRGVRRTDLG